MKGFHFLLVLQVLSVPVMAQFTDDFSTGTLSDEWQGDRDKFAVLNEELQLNDLEPTTSNTSNDADDHGTVDEALDARRVL